MQYVVRIVFPNTLCTYEISHHVGCITILEPADRKWDQVYGAAASHVHVTVIEAHVIRRSCGPSTHARY